jgi:transposase-like protein
MTINPKYAFKLALGYPPKTSWQDIVKQPVSVKKQSEYKRTKEYSHEERVAILEEMLEVGADEVMKKYQISRGALTTWSKKLHGMSYAQFADSRGKGFGIRRYKLAQKIAILEELDDIGWPALKKKYNHLDKQQLEFWCEKIYGLEISIPPLDSHGNPKKEK